MLPPLERRLFLASLTGRSQEDLFLSPSVSLTKDQKERLRLWEKRRLAGEPLAKILGTKEFFGHNFYTNAHTLDPRPETETLIEGVLKRFPDKNQPLRFLDLGTGTGCLLITLLTSYPKSWGVGLDLSQEALAVAKLNLCRHHVDQRGHVVLGFWAQALHVFPWDVMVANPPYVATGDSRLSRGAHYDPPLALFGGHDGLSAYRDLFTTLSLEEREKNYPSHAPRPRLFLELGCDQEHDVERLANHHHWKKISLMRDLSGIPRVIELEPCHVLA